MSVHFDETHRTAWLAFLDTEAGSTGLAHLRESKRPALRRTGAPHEMQFDAGSQDGFDIAINEVEALARLIEKKISITADRPPLKETRLKRE
jgi:hypothetical protein